MDKLCDEQCHRNVKQLGKHIECTQEYYQIEKFGTFGKLSFNHFCKIRIYLQ